jgi:excisionase family DNA binding protein
MNYNQPTARIPNAVAATGLSRSAFYRLAGEGKIRMVKAGRATLVDMASVHAYLSELPEASIAGPKAATTAK